MCRPVAHTMHAFPMCMHQGTHRCVHGVWLQVPPIGDEDGAWLGSCHVAYEKPPPQNQARPPVQGQQPGAIYRFSRRRASCLWSKHRLAERLEPYNLVIVGDTMPLAWPLLHAGWPGVASSSSSSPRPKRLLLWACNRFDYGAVGDELWYETVGNLSNRPAVTLVSSTAFEWRYAARTYRGRTVDVFAQHVHVRVHGHVYVGVHVHVCVCPMCMHVPSYVHAFPAVILVSSEDLLSGGTRNGCTVHAHAHICTCTIYTHTTCTSSSGRYAQLLRNSHFPSDAIVRPLGLLPGGTRDGNLGTRDGNLADCRDNLAEPNGMPACADRPSRFFVLPKINEVPDSDRTQQTGDSL